jgi:hypothetical protein
LLICEFFERILLPRSEAFSRHFRDRTVPAQRFWEEDDLQPTAMDEMEPDALVTCPFHEPVSATYPNYHNAEEPRRMVECLKGLLEILQVYKTFAFYKVTRILLRGQMEAARSGPLRQKRAAKIWRKGLEMASKTEFAVLISLFQERLEARHEL